jgi:hypothetical protein
MRICTQRSTGKLIEMQSLATPGTLSENAKQAGYGENDIDEHEGTGEELRRLLAESSIQPRRPTLNDVISVLSADQRAQLKHLVEGR